MNLKENCQDGFKHKKKVMIHKDFILVKEVGLDIEKHGITLINDTFHYKEDKRCFAASLFKNERCVFESKICTASLGVRGGIEWSIPLSNEGEEGLYLFIGETSKDIYQGHITEKGYPWREDTKGFTRTLVYTCPANIETLRKGGIISIIPEPEDLAATRKNEAEINAFLAE